MAARIPLYQEVLDQISAVTGEQRLRVTAQRRLALLVLGMLAAQSCVLNRVAIELHSLALTQAQQVESILRRLRRTLSSAALTAAASYQPAVRQVVDWEAVRRSGQPVVLALDESDQEDRLHLLRLSLVYRGSALPLAWSLWESPAALPEDGYWGLVEQVLEQAAAVLPADLDVLVLADRAFDIPAFVDRVSARGWHWLVRCKAAGTLRFRDPHGREREVRRLVQRHLRRPGQRWRTRGQVFKRAGWRTASLVGEWAPDEEEPLVVVSDLGPAWGLLRRYDRRFWLEAGFRQDKSRGWQWEASQVAGLAHQQVLLVGMAWASLVTLCLGAQQAVRELRELDLRQHRRQRSAAHRSSRSRGCRGRGVTRPQPQRPRASLFTLGLRQVRTVLYQQLEQAVKWLLPDPLGPSWQDQWLRAQAPPHRIPQTVRP